jgi:hypothetical protein
MKKIYLTRKQKLRSQIERELSKQTINIESILNCVDVYEKNNLATIESLKKQKEVTTNRIKGALKQTINAHGPITVNYISSATKRIYGSLLHNNKKQNILNKILTWIKKLN